MNTTTTIKPARVRVRKANTDIIPTVPKSLERGIKTRAAVVAGAKTVGSGIAVGAKAVDAGAKTVGSGIASGACAVGNFFKGLVKGA